jgi:regulator of replication initiation timing
MRTDQEIARLQDVLLKCEAQLTFAYARIAELQEEINILRAERDGETAAFNWMMRQNEQLQAEIQQLRTALVETVLNGTQPGEGERNEREEKRSQPTQWLW